MKRNATVLIVALLTGLGGCVGLAPGGPAPSQAFDGSFGTLSEVRALDFNLDVVDAIGPAGEARSAWLVEATNATNAHEVMVDVETGEPLGMFRENQLGHRTFSHTPPTLAGLARYPAFLGMTAQQAHLDPGDQLHYLGMAFDVIDAGPQSLSLSLALKSSGVGQGVELVYHVAWNPAGTHLVVSRQDDDASTEAIMWEHRALEPWPEVKHPNRSIFVRPADLAFGPDGTVPPTGEDSVPFSLETALDGLQEQNAEVSAFLERHSEAILTRAHYDADAVGTAETVYRHRWVMTLQGDKEAMTATASALADPVDGGSLEGTVMDEGVTFAENDLISPGPAEGVNVLALSAVYEVCSQDLPVGLVQLDFQYFGSTNGLRAGGTPLGGLSVWACGDVVLGAPAWDGVLGLRVRSPLP